MFWILLILYIVTLLIPFFYRREFDLFSPWRIYSILLFVNTIPFLMISHYTKDVVTYPVLNVVGTHYDNVIQVYIFNQSLFNIFYYFGFRRSHFKKIPQIFNMKIGTNYLMGLYIVLASFSLLYTIYFIQSVGGIEGLLLLFNDRAQIYEERTIWFMIVNFSIYLAGTFHIIYISRRGGNLFQLLANIVIAMIVLVSQGGRSPFILYLINITICYNYFIKKINIFSFKYIPIYTFVVAFVIIIFLVRTKGTDDMTETTIIDNLNVFISGNSYVDIQALIINFFDKNSYWGGESYKSLSGMFIPRSLYPDKMAIDEGVYVHEMIYNYKDVLKCKDFTSSYPPSTLGIMYANFGYLGIVFGGFLLGVIHKYAYNLFTKLQNVFVVNIYVFLIIKFQLTTFYIVNFIYNIILLMVFYYIIYFFSRLFRVKYSND